MRRLNILMQYGFSGPTGWLAPPAPGGIRGYRRKIPLRHKGFLAQMRPDLVGCWGLAAVLALSYYLEQL